MLSNFVEAFILILLLIKNDALLLAEPNDHLTFNGTSTPGKNCHRPCVSGRSEVCYFKFVMENYQTMGAACGKCAQGVIEDCFSVHCLPMDGVERGVLSINRQIPGPPILVCQNDWIVVDVENQMMGTTTALHWHGVHVKNTPWMDGVPFVTQCPINFASTFRYIFQANEAGTQFYHSHAGHHKLNGHYGPLIIRKAIEKEPYRDLYEFDLNEHTILINDWNHHFAEMFSLGLPTRVPGIAPENILINGKGMYKSVHGDHTPFAPVEIFKVKRKKSYRFRVINAASHYCAIKLQIQDHNMTVIATDSHDMKSIEVNTLYTTSGERYDFILNAKKRSGTYCIEIRYIDKCACPTCQQYALLVYTNDNDNHNVSVHEYETYREEAQKCYSTNITSTVKLNHPNTTCYGNDTADKCVVELSSLQENQSWLNDSPDNRFYLGIYIHSPSVEDIFQEDKYHSFINIFNSTMEQMSINNISLIYPSLSALTQTDELSDDMFCDPDNLPNGCKPGHICHCTYRIKVKLNSIVEMVIVDETGEKLENHPFHLHGHGFYVTSMGQIHDKPISVQLYKELERTNSLPRSSKNQQPIFKDTVSVQYRGYVVIRFRASNPGMWLFHCHYENHSLAGMGLILQVGEYSDFKKSPKGFPTCGSYFTDINEIMRNE